MRTLFYLVTFLPIFLSAQQTKGLFKYATVYTSAFASTPMKVRPEYYINQMGEIKDITIENPYDYTTTIGIRRVARYDYENRRNRFYDGQTESTISLNATVGSVKGFEYLAQFDQGRQQGRNYMNQRYFLRYLSDHWIIKGEYFSQGLINLRYGQTDLRIRAHIGDIDFSIGLATRQNKPYGYNPVEELLDSIPWFAFAYGQGFSDFMYGIDNNLNDSIDDYDWRWEDLEGNEIADSDEDFRRHVFPDLMRRYNRSVLDSIGYLGSISGIEEWTTITTRITSGFIRG